MVRNRRNPPPITPERLEEMALAYVARFATSRAKLVAYMMRKLRERGWDGEAAPDPDAIADRMVASGFVDDEAFARARSGSLLRRGYGMRRVTQALGAAGIEEDIRAELQPAPAAQRQAALAMAMKRRFGPFSPEPPDRHRREKQLAAMLRAGHPLDNALKLVDAPTIEAAQAWADEPGEDDPCD
jgi:regulatory protein